MNRSQLIVVLFAMLTVGTLFQSCGNVLDFGSKETSSQAPRGNGDFYTGKTDMYAYFDANTPCANVGNQGRPFPNRQIQYYPDLGAAFLVRENCKDLEPLQLGASDYRYDAGANTIAYQGQIYNLQTDPEEWNKIPLACPVGMSPTGAMATNAFNSPMQITAPGWSMNPGIQSYLFGSLEALPRYRVQRTDANYLEHWRRTSQYVPLNANQQYSISFLVSQGNTSAASIMYWDTDTYQFVVRLDFLTGVPVISYQPGFAPGSITATAQPYGNGYNLTVFFVTPPTTGAPEIGVTPTYTHVGPTAPPGALGDYLHVTAGGLRQVNAYCN